MRKKKPVNYAPDYTYDKAGNVTEETVAGTNKSFTYDGDLMTDKGNDSVSWDLNGQMTSGITASMEWNWDGKLQSASAGGTSIDLKYDPSGNRIFKSVDDGSTTNRKYIVDVVGRLPVILLEIDPDENDPNDSIAKTYLYTGAQVLAQHDGYYGDSIYFYLHDRLCSIRQMIDSSANVKNKYVYPPFGESFSSEQAENVSNDFMFTGQYFDPEIEQYYLRARQYDTGTYIFTSRDPFAGSFNDPLELHRYLYCLNNPANRTDPSGEFSLIDISVTGAIQTGLRWYGYYTTYQNIKGYARELTAGASIRNVLLGAVGDVAFNMAAGKMLGFAAKSAGKALNLAGKAASKPRHHVWPKFLQGAKDGIIKKLPANLHIKLHSSLKRNLRDEFKDVAVTSGRNFDQWRTKVEWREVLSDPLNNMKAMQILVDTTGDFDMAYGENVLESLFQQMAKQWK